MITLDPKKVTTPTPGPQSHWQQLVQAAPEVNRHSSDPGCVLGATLSTK